MKIVIYFLSCMAISSPAVAGPVADALSQDLQQKEAQAKSDIDGRRFCDARKQIESALAELTIAQDQAAAGQLISLKSGPIPQSIASPDDVIWIVQAKTAVTTWQHDTMPFCPNLNE